MRIVQQNVTQRGVASPQSHMPALDSRHDTAARLSKDVRYDWIDCCEGAPLETLAKTIPARINVNPAA